MFDSNESILFDIIIVHVRKLLFGMSITSLCGRGRRAENLKELDSPSTGVCSSDADTDSET